MISSDAGATARAILQVLPVLAGVLAIISSASVLTGWTFDIEVLKRLKLEWPPQTPVTALCFGLLGSALVARVKPSLRWFAFALGAIVFLLQAIRLTATLRGVPTFVDSLLFASKLTPGITAAPNTSVCFVLLAGAIMLFSGVTTRFAIVARVLAVGAALIATVALVGYVAGILGLYQIDGQMPMRLQTAITALVVAVGLLCAIDPDATENTSNALPFGTGLLVSMFTLLLLILSASFWGERQTNATSELAFATQAQALEAAEIFSTLQDAELGQRGYLVTEDEAFLAPYYAAMDKAETLNKQLDDLRGDTGASEAEIARLQDLITRRVAILTETITLAKAGQRSEALALVKTGRGKAIMDEIRVEIAASNASRDAALRNQFVLRDKISLVVRITETIGLLLLIVTGVIVLRQTRLAMASQRRAREAADAANKAKSSFLASMSHELRTPMTGIIGMCDLLLMGEQSPEDRQLTRILARSAQTLLALLNDILDLSKIESGHLMLERADFKLSFILEEAASLFGPLASQKGIVLNVNTAARGHDVFKGDPQRLQQVLFNLIGNAIKFTERGSITVEHQQVREAGGTTRLTVSVIDTGIGISEEGRARLFRDFEQEDASTSRRFGGSGLGLSISRRLIGAMGGTIDVESTKGKGSRFFFTVALPDGDEKAAITKSGNATALAAEHLRDLHLSILVAEDTPATQHLITTMLTRWGHQVVAVSDGFEAVRAANERAWDIIIMDMQMPGMDGPEAMRIIRAGGPSAKLPIIALTADAIQQNHAAYLEAGADVVTTKPVDWHLLAQHIARLVDGAPRAALLRTQVEPTASPSAPQGSSDAPVFESGVLEETRDAIGNDATVAIITSALESLRQTVVEIHTAVQTADHVQVRRLAHKVRGIALQLGAARASAVALSIESDTVTDVGAAADLLRVSIGEAGRAIESYVRDLEPASAESS